MPIVRHSKKRDAMLNLMRGTKCHPTADWVYQGMREIFPDISLGTVYRNLNQLCEERLVMRVGVVDGHERFDAVFCLCALFLRVLWSGVGSAGQCSHTNLSGIFK